jgi:uncharacterized protein (TIGR02246 family)
VSTGVAPGSLLGDGRCDPTRGHSLLDATHRVHQERAPIHWGANASRWRMPVVIILRARSDLGETMNGIMKCWYENTTRLRVLSGSAVVLAGLSAARWARSDAAGISNLFMPDADLVIPNGTVASGRTAIRAFYVATFAAGYAGSSSGARIFRVRSLTSKLAIVDATWFIAGSKAPNGAAAPTEHGILAAVIWHDGDAWRIAALREQTSAATLAPARETP